MSTLIKYHTILPSRVRADHVVETRLELDNAVCAQCHQPSSMDPRFELPFEQGSSSSCPRAQVEVTNFARERSADAQHTERGCGQDACRARV